MKDFFQKEMLDEFFKSSSILIKLNREGEVFEWEAGGGLSNRIPDLKGKRLQDSIQIYNPEVLQELLQKARDSDSLQVLDKYILWPELLRWFQVWVKPSGDEWLVMLRDITEAKEQESIYKYIFDNATNPLVLLDPSGMITEANQPFLLLLGDEEIKGKNVRELHRRLQVSSPLSTKLGECLAGREANYECRHLLHGEERYFKIKLKPVFGSAGQVQNIIMEIIDCTEDSKSLIALRQQRQWYKALVDSLPESAVFVYDRSMDFVFADGSLFNDDDEAKAYYNGKNIRLLALDSNTEQELINVQASLQGETVHSETVSGISGKIYSITYTPLYDAEQPGVIIGGMAFALVISQYKKLEQELRLKIEQLEQYNYIASHDLQEPLRMIVTYGQLLAQKYGGVQDEEFIEYIGYMEEGARRIQQMIYDLKAFHQAGEPMVKTEVNANMALAAACSKWIEEFELKKVNIVSGELPILYANPQSFKLLLECLIQNAIKFRQPDKEVHIEINALCQEEFWLFTVKDNGIGIQPDYAEKIFHIFQRLHPRDKYPGTGIGLPICKKIVEAAGGNIWIAPNHTEGSTVYFTWPV